MKNTRQPLGSVISKVSTLEHNLGRAPGTEEIAAAIGVDVVNYNNLLDEVNLLYAIYTNSYVDEKNQLNNLFKVTANYEYGGSKEDNKEDEHMAKVNMLAGAISSLPQDELLVVTLYFYEELNLKEISLVLESSESTCEHLFAQAILRLTSKMAGMLRL